MTKHWIKLEYQSTKKADNTDILIIITFNNFVQMSQVNINHNFNKDGTSFYSRDEKWPYDKVIHE